MLTIDDREQVRARESQSKLLLELQQIGVGMRFKHLDFGDIAFRANGPAGHFKYGVEVKAVGDLIQSLLTKRLQAHQLPGLLKEYERAAILIIGEYREGDDGSLHVPIKESCKGASQWRLWVRHRSPMTYEQLEGQLRSIQNCAGIQIVRARDDFEAARWLAREYGWWQKDFEQHHGHKAISQESSGIGFRDSWFDKTRYFAEEVAFKLPGIGIDKCRIVADHFGTALEMAQASISDWRKIQWEKAGRKQSIGPETARKCWRAFRTARK